MARMISRRSLLKLFGATLVGGLGLGGYAFAFEPRFRLEVVRYRLRPPGWPALDKPLRIAAIADIHACEPWMPPARIEEVVATANALKPDLTVLLGDYVAGLRRFRSRAVSEREWGPLLGKLEAPLGTYAVLGNHDWWHDIEGARAGLRRNDIPLLENDALKLKPASAPSFWLAGLGDQLAFPRGHGHFDGVHDMRKTVAQITDDAPAILLAHEPDIFPEVPARFGLTLSGHTHGGQVNLPLIGRPIVPSMYGQRYAYGHVIEEGRHLIVSGGLGLSILPVRFGVPPEIVLIELG